MRPNAAEMRAPKFMNYLILIPFLIAGPFILGPKLLNRLFPPPIVAVQGEGYFLDYRPKFHSCGKSGCRDSTRYYIGTGVDGKCYAANYPSDWSMEMCAIRLKQVAAGDCAVVPGSNDDFCRQMLLDLSMPGAIKRKVQLTFYNARGETQEAKERNEMVE